MRDFVGGKVWGGILLLVTKCIRNFDDSIETFSRSSSEM